MKLIVALGNPTLKYDKTRHNVGFMALDSYLNIKKLALTENKKFKSKFLKTKISNDDIVFLQPQTFMNLSGIAVREVVEFYKIENILVLYDDLDLAFGTIRFKYGGSSGGHNGIKSIDECIKKNYLKLKIGISHPKANNNESKTNIKSSVKNMESSIETCDKTLRFQKMESKLSNLVESKIESIPKNLQDSLKLQINLESKNIKIDSKNHNKSIVSKLDFTSNNFAQNSKNINLDSKHLKNIKVMDFVLEKFNDSELEALEKIFAITNNALDSFINNENLLQLQNKYNRKYNAF
ncbi:MAG: aminoacyl-tRNA hydrolase [Helicobacteraceae bacterium]|nr:aminoacyl-tRNA hydrolase [Helicobacteraceae bacterium]